MELLARGHRIVFPRPPLVMGIVNLGADSFSGDGVTDPARALEHARRLVEDGAEIIDVGAESARTNREAIGEAEEADRLCAFVERWKTARPGGVLLSINTWRPAVARQVLHSGGDLLNDLGGLPTDENARICAELGVALLVMHTVGTPKVAHTHVRFPDVMQALEAFFEEKIAVARAAGLSETALILDPGLDFAKQREDNLRVLREMARLHRFGRPILLPISRKTVIGDVLGLPIPAERDAGTIACLVQGVLQGAHIFRVHHVRAAAQAISTLTAIGMP